MFLLFDIGGSKMRLAFSEDGQNFTAPLVVPTPQHFEEGMRVFEERARTLMGNKKIVAACGGIAGPFNKEKTSLLNAPHLTDWIGKPLGERLKKILGCPVYLENDAALGGLGEAVMGVGRGEKIVAYVTIGTGVGGARIVDGQIDDNAFGFEPGHQIIRDDGRRLEDLVSGSGFQKIYHRPPLEVIESEAWEEAARWLAYGLHNIILLWSPHVVILGGSMILGRQAISVELVSNHIKSLTAIFPQMPAIKRSMIGDLVGLHGALIYIKQKLSTQL